MADTRKREFLKKATYVVPAVLTLAAAPSFASAGSSSKKGKKGNGPKQVKKVNMVTKVIRGRD